jgi:hypothetical protein
VYFLIIGYCLCQMQFKERSKNFGGSKYEAD